MVEAALEGRRTPADRVTTAERDPTGKLIGTRHAHVWRLALAEPLTSSRSAPNSIDLCRRDRSFVRTSLQVAR